MAANIADEVPAELWTMIEAARGDPSRLRGELKAMTRKQLEHFCWTYEELATHLRTERHLPYVQSNLSEDGMAELANWVVAQGKSQYRKILEHAQLIPRKKNDPGLLSALIEEYEERFHDDMPLNTNMWDDEWREHGKESPWD